jgi:hypothetical protein
MLTERKIDKKSVNFLPTFKAPLLNWIKLSESGQIKSDLSCYSINSKLFFLQPFAKDLRLLN